MPNFYYGKTGKFGKRIHGAPSEASRLFFLNDKGIRRVQAICGRDMDAPENGDLPRNFVHDFCRACFRYEAWDVFEKFMLGELTDSRGNRIQG